MNPNTSSSALPENPESRGIARRTLISAAWAVPVVAAAIAAPAAAASGSGILAVYNAGLDEGGVQHRLTFNVSGAAPYVAGAGPANISFTFYLNGAQVGSFGPQSTPNNTMIATMFPVDGLVKNTTYTWYVKMSAPGYQTIYAPVGAPGTPGSKTTPNWWS